MAAARELRHTPAVLLSAAEALARSGRPEQALRWLERAAGMGAVGNPQRLEEAFAPSQEIAAVRSALVRLQANAASIARGRVAFTLAEKDLIPESVAYDAREDAFYIGSFHKRKIVRLGVDGDARDFVPQATGGLWTVMGMKVEPRRRELWAAACNSVDGLPSMVPDDPLTRGRTGIFRFDLETGDLVDRHVAGDRNAPLCFNDLVITPDGIAWISAEPRGIYRVRPGGSPERFLDYPGFVNGIAASDDGRLLFLADSLRGVQILDVMARRIRPLSLPETVTLAGIDGLYVRGRTLVAVQNGLSRSLQRVIQAELDPALERILCLAVLDRNRPEFDFPTTGVLVGDDLYYIASSQMRSYDEAGLWPLDRLIHSTIIRTHLAGRGCGF